MSDGFKKMVINTQERAVSTDINRLQLFKGKDFAELLRYLLDVTGNDDLTTGVISEPNTVETPLRAEVINGLLARPQLGSQNVFIDPGVVMVMAPDAAADESNYKYVSDVGNTTPGSLVIAVGGGGATRIDVVECRINPTDLIVTDNRDIFNPSTGLFTATSVTKERSGRLEYRVRQGTAGGGYPGSVSGWLPLMIASVPNTAVNNDTVTFWDVRPLISDREYGLQGLSNDVGFLRESMFLCSNQENAAQWRFRGKVEGAFHGRRIGGCIRRGSPGTDNDYIDLAEAANQSPAFAIPAAGGIFYVYLLFPHGLPRWARYADSPSARQPRSPRGIFAVSTVAPTHGTGQASAGIAPPTATGLVGTTTEAFVVAAGITAAGPAFSNFTCGLRGEVRTEASRIITIPVTNTTTEQRWPITAGVDYPTHAKAIIASIDLIFAGPETIANTTVIVKNGAETVNLSVAEAASGFASTVHTIQTMVIPVPIFYPASAPTPTASIALFHAATGAAPVTAELRIRGWVL